MYLALKSKQCVHWDNTLYIPSMLYHQEPEELCMFHKRSCVPTCCSSNPLSVTMVGVCGSCCELSSDPCRCRWVRSRCSSDQRWQCFLMCRVVADPPPCVVTLRNVGFPRPECRVTAPISAVWWLEEEATEVLAWRERSEGRRRWERLEGILLSASSWSLSRHGRTPIRPDSDAAFLGETPPRLCASVPVCLPPRRVKNWVRGVPLLGSWTS